MKSNWASQTTNTIIMVRPDHFSFDEQTATTNVFQHHTNKSDRTVKEAALKEFEEMVKILRGKGIRVLILPSKKGVITPDAVFPNNWFTHHQNGIIVLYPMLNLTRRDERQTEALIAKVQTVGITNPKVIDLTVWEKEGKILEGTGSIALDRVNKVAFAVESKRTTQVAFTEWGKRMGYKVLFLHAFDRDGFPIYHTNVFMYVGRGFAVVCLDALTDPIEKKTFVLEMKRIQKELIPISFEQMFHFCGNILQLQSEDTSQKIVMSKRAYDAFTNKQKESLQTYGELVPISIPTIETVGGGSARCMMAEVFPPR